MSRILVAAALLGLIAFLAGCSPQPADAPEVASSATLAGFGYDIALSFSPQAATQLKNTKIKVTGTYYGLPRPEAMNQVSKDGVIAFGVDTIEVAAVDQTVHMTGTAVAANKLKLIAGAKPLVQITVSVPGTPNRLSCSPFQDYVAVAQEQPVRMSCTLSKLGEL